MNAIEKQAYLRREEDILDRIENVKRLIEMETTLITSTGAGKFVSYHRTDRDGKSYGNGVLSELRDEIQMQLLSITALCYGKNPDMGEPVPMLEWKEGSASGQHPSDRFWDVWEECLMWNA